jgi:hypothetical protein
MIVLLVQTELWRMQVSEGNQWWSKRGGAGEVANASFV